MVDAWLATLTSYPVLFVVCATSGLGVPVPEDALTVYTGMQLGLGVYTPFPAIPVIVAGFVVRDVIAWSLGHFLGRRWLDAAWFRRIVPPHRIDRVRGMYAAQGSRAVIAGRFMVGVRTLAFFFAGASGVPFRTFIAYDLIGMMIVATAELALGYWVGPPALSFATDILGQAGNLWLIAIGLVVLFLVGRRVLSPSSRSLDET